MAPVAASVETVILGAGLSGLTCGWHIARAGHRVLVLEARDRVGGRAFSPDLGGTRVDLGAQWVSPAHTELRQLLQELAIPLRPHPHRGRRTLLLDGQPWPWPGLGPLLNPVASLEAALTLRGLDRHRLDVRPAATAPLPEAGLLDARTLEDWMRQTLWTSGARRLLGLTVRVLMAQEPSDVSFLALLHHLEGSGGLSHLIRTRDGGMQDVVVGGAQQIAETLADRLPGQIRLHAPVEQVEQDLTGATIHGAGFAVRARRVVVALPPPQTARLLFRPELPAEAATAQAAMRGGAVLKAALVFDRPFWRDRGHNGQIIADGEPFHLCADASPPDGPGVLVVMTVGDTALALRTLPREQFVTRIAERLGRVLGPQARQPLTSGVMDWSSDPWSPGGYFAVPTPGALHGVGRALAAPCGRIHFAGTERASAWRGYLEGAVRAGRRAAHEVLASLGAHPTPPEATSADGA